jgi:hypothetical protein
MPLMTLSQTNSLHPGADLWITPGLHQSKAAHKLDWYLNFQLTRASFHQVKPVSAELKEILKNCELSNKDSHQQHPNRLMVDSSHLLPNRWLIQVLRDKDFEPWVATIAEVWTGLRKPSMRVFLPTGLSSGEFQKLWHKHHSFDDFSIVVD